MYFFPYLPATFTLHQVSSQFTTAPFASSFSFSTGNILKVIGALNKPVVYGIAAYVHLVVQQAYHLAIYWGVHVVLVEYEIGKQRA